MKKILAILILMVSPAVAQDVPLSFDLASDHVDITTAFDGEKLVVFGVRRGTGNVVITVEGPLSDMKVRRKGRILGAWVNKTSMLFKKMPIFYDYAVVPGAPDLHGVESLAFVPEDEDEDAEDVATFKKALIRNKQAAGLYPVGPQVVKFYEQGDLFRAEFHVPPNVPVGEFTVNAYYEENDAGTAAQRKFRVAQVGTNANIYSFSHEHSVFYALMCIGLALFAGWFSNRVRKRT